MIERSDGRPLAQDATTEVLDDMTEKKPPDWDNDPLSLFFKDAEYNERANAFNFPKTYELLGQVHALFQKFEEVIEKDNRDELLVPRILMVRVHYSFLAGIRLAMSGQVSESFPILRSVVEYAWYALHIAKDPGGTKRSKTDDSDPLEPDRGTIWLCRNDDAEAKKRCRNEFTVRKVRQTHEEQEAADARELHKVYETLIDWGAHPNQLSVMMGLVKTEETDNHKTYDVGMFQWKLVPFGLRMAVETAIGALKTFQLVFPERFTIAGLDLEIEKLILQTNALFPKVRPVAGEEKGNLAS